MIVCMCEGVTSRAVAQAVDDGCHSITDVARRTGAGTDCGTCTPLVTSLIDRRRLGPGVPSTTRAPDTLAAK